MTRFQARHQWVRDELKRCVEFWLKYGIDRENGGVYTCIDRTGKVFSNDKSVWMQGRCGWIFAYLCTVYGVKEEWLETIHPEDFLLELGRKLCNSHTAAIHQSLALTRPERVKEAVDLMRNAQRVFAMGQGGSTLISMLAAHQFSTVSPRFFAVQDPHIQASTAALLFSLIVCAMALPKQVILIPLIKEISFLGLYDSLWSVIFPTGGYRHPDGGRRSGFHPHHHRIPDLPEVLYPGDHHGRREGLNLLEVDA